MDSPPITGTKSSSEKIGFLQKMAYGSGMMSYVVMVRGVNQFANPIFNDCMGVDPRLVSWVLGGSRLWDAVTDPMMGNITDNTRSRWGRRRPWIALGAMLSAITFAAIWLFPAGLSEMGYFLWFLCTSLVFFLAFTVFSVPYMALGMEMSPDYNERTAVVAYRTVISQVGAFLISGIYWFISLDRFDDMAHGMRYAGIIAAVLIFSAGIVPALFAREHQSVLDRQKKGKRVAKVSLVKSFMETIRELPFQILIGITVLMLIGLMLVGHLGYYVTVYHIFGGVKGESLGTLMAVGGISSQVCTMLFVPVLAKVSSQLGKRETLLVAMVLAIIGSGLKWVCFTPDNPWLSIIPGIVMSGGLAATWTLINAMIPDIVDLDELKTGERREGMYSAVYSWVFKLGVSLALVVSGYVLTWSGFNVDLGTDQSPQAIFYMRLFFTLIPVVSISLAFLLLLVYPLKESRVREIQAELKARVNAEEEEENKEKTND
ncbi:MFS transporter [Coraliomargarita sp. SDUM461003]|uniref:MFS transporter n=1 Tax=Thalassobacterium maritimum TaxID=3041265 RepID=A0ABU1ASZ9_9BACT|nr:MFS transporter [Coraliomargarita sp. SDUM461003]MDQ8206379.1 MFS transporter [Coraliomargarita sp. SDUM461003]